MVEAGVWRAELPVRGGHVLFALARWQDNKGVERRVKAAATMTEIARRAVHSTLMLLERATCARACPRGTRPAQPHISYKLTAH